jgi:hypothetical protein|tara:strand:+ start:13257 stop:13553 length:297 start_codon:yes stop_codon:yes gene_type:complete
MPANTRSRKRTHEGDDVATAMEAIPGLSLDIVITHVLSRKNLPDTADLARLRGVSHAMRDALATGGRPVTELEPSEAALFGCLGTLQRMRRRGPLLNC